MGQSPKLMLGPLGSSAHRCPEDGRSNLRVKPLPWCGLQHLANTPHQSAISRPHRVRARSFPLIWRSWLGSLTSRP